jgi:vancomycin resistance protein YoaR
MFVSSCAAALGWGHSMKSLRLFSGSGSDRGIPTNPWLLTLIGVGGLVLLFFLVLVGFRISRPGVLPGVEVAGVAVGGLDRDELAGEVEGIAEARRDDPVAVVLDHDDRRAVTTPRTAMGYSIDEAATAEAAWRRGRQPNPFTALADHFRAFRQTTDVELRETLDEERLDAWVDEVADELDHPPVDGSVAIDGDQVTVEMPERGAVVDRDSLRVQASEVLSTAGERTIVADSATSEPRLDPDDVEAVAERAWLAVSDGVRLYRDDAALELSPSEIGDLLHVDDDLRLRADPEALAVDDETLEALETDRADAQIRLEDGEVTITPSVEGFRFDPEIAAAQVLDVATSSGPREAELDGEVTEPDMTTADAEALGITERVSTFTTHHACCEGRVQNIQRMADLVRGVVLRPGEEFSINEHVGRRTRANGFTDGGVIIAGEFEEAVGGGVSQFATTFFNAAFEGGYEILAHQPHSYYISRYPVGREATLNWPNIDVKIRNDSPHGLLIHTRYTPTSITVDLYGQKWVDVEIVTGPRRNVQQPPERYEEDEALEPGEEEVVQEGREGFQVTYTRTRRFPGGNTDQRSWNHTYRPEPRIIEHNPAEPEDEDEDDGSAEAE